MSPVNTVLGPIDSSELGFTLSHEHITLGAAGAAAAYPGFQDRQAIADAAAAALSEAYAGSVRAIIDVTTFDLGRDVALMQEVSRRSGVHAIPCTGNHLAVPRIFWGAPVDRVAALFIREITEGIENTGVRRASSRSPATGAASPKTRKSSCAPPPAPATPPEPASVPILGRPTAWATSRFASSRRKAWTSTASISATATTIPILAI